MKRDGAVFANYIYDNNGNRLSGPGLATTPTYDDQDRLITYAGNSYTYTASGDLRTKTTALGITSYRYDVLGNLMRAILADGRRIDYVVDGESRRIGKKVNGSLTQGLLYQDGLKPIAELNSANAVVSRFVYADKLNAWTTGSGLIFCTNAFGCEQRRENC